MQEREHSTCTRPSRARQAFGIIARRCGDRALSAKARRILNERIWNKRRAVPGTDPDRIKRIRRGGGGPARPPAARDYLVEREDAADWTSRSSFRRSKHRARRAPSRRRTGRGRAEGTARQARRDTR